MSKLVLSGDTSGSVTLDAPAVSGTTTLTLPTTTGTLVVTSGAQTIEFADGSASTPSITNSGDTNTGIFFPAADTIAFAEGGTEAMRIDSSGNVGIGNTTAYNRLDVLASGNSNSVHLSNAANTDTGAYLNATGSAELMLNAGASYNSYSAPNFVMNAKATIASGVYCTGDGIRFWVNTGLTAGTTFNQTERMRIDSSGNLLFNSGYGSVATAYGCRAWVNFNGTGTVAINGSGNVTSITDNGVGDYTVNLTTALVDANYSVALTGNFETTVGGNQYFCGIKAASGVPSTKTSSALRIFSAQYNGAAADTQNQSVAFFR